MSVIQRIRDKGAWVVFAIIALALIAFILQDGVGRGGSAFSNTTTIGKVNGVNIERTDFEEKLEMQERMYGAQGVQRDQLIGSVWNQEVEEAVLQAEYKKLGITVSGKELTDILFGENSPLRQEFTDPATGIFKADEARAAFNNLKKSKNAEQIKMIQSVYINPIISQTLRQKYLALLQQSSYVPKWLVDKQQADNNAISSISYVYVPYVAVPDTVVKVSDADIAAYLKKHSKEYQKEEETRAINYVSFSAAPSAEDTLSTLNQIESLKNEFATTKDNAAFLNRVGTELAYYDSYFSKSKMQQPNKDTLVRIPVGQVYGPFLDGSNYVLAKMVGTKNWPDSAKVRHILIGTYNPQTQQVTRVDSVAKKLADSIQAAIKGGASFDELCKKYTDDGGSKEKNGVYDFFPQGQMVVPFNDFAFDNPVGTKGIVKTDFGYHYIEVLGQKNPSPVYKIAYLAKPIQASELTNSTANTAAAQFAANAKDKKLFDAEALKVNLGILTSAEIKQNDFAINGLGQSRELIRWIYENKAGSVSQPTLIGDQYIVAIISSVNPAGLMSPAEARPMVEGFVRNEKKAKYLIDTKFKGATLEAIASATGAQVQRADSISFATPFVPNIGSEPKVVGAAFNKTLAGKISEPIAGYTGLFAVKVEGNSAKVSAMDSETVKQTLLQGNRIAVFRGIDALKKAATIKDYRFKFY